MSITVHPIIYHSYSITSIEKYNTYSLLVLPNKTKSIYTLLFNELRNIALQNDLILNPKTITVDYEKAAIGALKNIFPNSKIKGCNFHFNQCIFRKIQEIGLRQDYFN